MVYLRTPHTLALGVHFLPSFHCDFYLFIKTLLCEIFFFPVSDIVSALLCMFHYSLVQLHMLKKRFYSA